MSGTPAEQLQQIEQEYLQKREEVTRQIQEHNETAEQSEAPTEHETLSQVVEGAIQQHAPEFKASSHAPGKEDDLSPEAKEKVQSWVNETFNNGLSAGVKAAKDSDDFSLIDAFHGALTGSLYKSLIEQGKIEVLK